MIIIISHIHILNHHQHQHNHQHDLHHYQAGFKIGMSDGGLVTEAKPSIQWDKVKVTLLIVIQGDKSKNTRVHHPLW